MEADRLNAGSAAARLLARQWLLDGSRLRGFYLFADGGSAAEAFLHNCASDPAYALLAPRLGESGASPPRISHSAAQPMLERPVFIIAAPRSGSTLLFELLRGSPDVWTQGGEGQGAVDGIVGLHQSQRGYPSDRLTDEDLAPGIRERLHAGWGCGWRDRDGTEFDEGTAGARGVKARLLDKTTEHSLRVAFLARACPEARFVFLHRDARQNVSSLMRAWDHGGFVRFSDLPAWPERAWCFLLPPEWRGLIGRSRQEIATAQWEAANRWALHDLELLDDARWTSVDYNDLVAHPREVVLRLCRFLELEVDSHFEMRLQRPLLTSGTAIGPPSMIKWRSHAGLDVAALESVTRDTSGRLRSLRVERGRGATPSGGTPPLPRTVLFACHLEEVPAAPWAHRSGECGAPPAPDNTLLVESSVRFQRGTSIPVGLATAARFRDRFLADRPILWTRDILSGAYRPFWVPRRLTDLFARLEPDAPVPPGMEAWEGKLHAAGVVATPAERAINQTRAAALRRQLAEAFARRGYCAIPEMLPSWHTASLARYYRELIASGKWELGDAQVARRHGWHNESIARFFHHQFTELVGLLVGHRVCPAYTYVSAYRRGAELTPHVDRKQCEYTLSLIVDEADGSAADWPLWLFAFEGRSSVTARVGDGVLFRGHDLPHWREASPHPDLALTTLLFHYVSSGFRETLD